MLHIDFNQAQIILPQLLDAALKGEEVVITREDRPVAKLVGLLDERGDLRLGSAQGLVAFSENFDAPLEGFEEYQ